MIKSRDPLVDGHFCRTLFVEKVYEAWKLGKEYLFEGAQEVIKKFSEFLEQEIKRLEDEEYKLSDDVEKNVPNSDFVMGRLQWALDFIKNLKKDVDGEVTLAIK